LAWVSVKRGPLNIQITLPEEIEIKTALVRDPELMEQTDVVFTNNINDIVHDPEIELVVEVMGGITTAYEYVRACLLAKKSVVTANKNLIADLLRIFFYLFFFGSRDVCNLYLFCQCQDAQQNQ